MTRIRLDGERFRLEDSEGRGALIRPEGAGFLVEPDDGSAPMRIAPPGDGSSGLVLTGADGVERARTSALDPATGPAGTTLLTADGRLFVVRAVGGTSFRFELLGWESPGAYLVAWPAQDGARIETTTAGRELPDRGAVLLLFATEVVRGEA